MNFHAGHSDWPPFFSIRAHSGSTFECHNCKDFNNWAGTCPYRKCRAIFFKDMRVARICPLAMMKSGSSPVVHRWAVYRADWVHQRAHGMRGALADRSPLPPLCERPKIFRKALDNAAFEEGGGEGLQKGRSGRDG
jgi:hypothetical protein